MCVGRPLRSAARSSRRSLDLAFMVIRDGAGSRGEVILLKRGCWSGGGGFAFLLRLRQWEATYLGPRQHGDVPW
jgi:hypothetical protein